VYGFLQTFTFSKILQVLALLRQYDGTVTVKFCTEKHSTSSVLRAKVYSVSTKGGYHSLPNTKTVKFEVSDLARVTFVYQFHSNKKFILSY